MKKLILSSLLLILACTPQHTPSYRIQSAPITSIALFDPAKFEGSWQVVASYSGQICEIKVALLKPDLLDWSEHKCNGKVLHGVAPVTGPGRFTPKIGTHKGLQHWVMWVDQDYRTAVIGTPSGEFGMILNRDRDVAADKMAAAREILAWNGYKLDGLALN
jgi:apolipoprotein D and lipocalin family protein